MRAFRFLLTSLVAASLVAGCADTPSESGPAPEVTAEAVLESVGEGLSASPYLERAPEAVRLTDEQRAELRAIHTAFREAHGADWRALQDIVRRAMEARRNGADRETVRGMLMESQPIRERLRPAFAQLRSDVHDVLTDAQRAWLRDNARRMGPRLPELPPRRG